MKTEPDTTYAPFDCISVEENMLESIF